MAINFSALPQSNPFSVPKPGIYHFTVTKAEMRKPKDVNKPDYLSLTLSLTNLAGKKVGNVFDGMYESASAAILYKLQRFTRALNINLTGEAELKDLAKLVVNRSGLVDIENVKDDRFPDDDSKVQAKVKLFGSECYWKTEELPQVADPEEAAPQPVEVSDEDVPFEFNSADGEVPSSSEY